MKYTTLIVKTSYDYSYLKSKKKIILKEIKNISGLSTIKLILCFNNMRSDFKLAVWFLNEQEINKTILTPKIVLILKNILGDMILSVD